MPHLALLLITLLMMSACGTLASHDRQTSQQNDAPAITETTAITASIPPEQAETTRPFPIDTFYDLLVAEVAANRRQYPLAVQNYVRQAEVTGDLAIIARAARITQFYRDYPKAIRMALLWLEQTPDDLEALSLMTTAYIELNDPSTALDYGAKILALIDSNNAQAQQQAAITETIANRSQGQSNEVLQALIVRFQTLGEEFSQYPAVKVGLSRLYEHLGDNAAAYSTIEQTLAFHPDYMPAVMQQVRLLQISQQPEAAIARLQALLTTQPNNTRLQLVYARLLMQTNPREAFTELTKLAEQSPEADDITFLRALVALEIDKLNVAEMELKQLLSTNYRPNTINFYLGNLETKRGENDRALIYYLDVGPSEEYISAQTLAGGIIALNNGVAAARQHFAQKRASSPNFRPQLFIAEATLLDQKDEKSQAIAVLSQGIEQFPDNISLRYNRSTYYEQDNQLDLMEVDLRHILALDPDNASAMNALGYVLTNKTDRHLEALPLIERALELRPDDAAIIDSMGWVLYRLGRFEEALAYLRKAFSLLPDPEVAAHLGEVLWMTGEQVEAKTIWRETLEKHPDDRFILETLRRFNLES